MGAKQAVSHLSEGERPQRVAGGSIQDCHALHGRFSKSWRLGSNQNRLLEDQFL